MTQQQRRQRLGRERMLIGIFLVRQIASVILLGAMVAMSLRLPDRRIAFVLGPVAAAFTIFVLVLTVKYLRTYQERKRRVDALEARS